MSSINEKILKIMSLALEISPADMPKNSGKQYVFLEYYPHCSLLVVRVCKKWRTAEHKEILYGDSENSCEKADEIIAFLEKLKEVQKNGGTV